MLFKHDYCKYVMKIPIKGLIFDLDGTLVDSSQDLIATANATRLHFGHSELNPSLIISYVGDGLTVLIRRLFPDCNNIQLQEALEFFRNHYKIHCTDYTQPYPGVVKTLQYFHQKTKAVVTNKYYDLSCLVLQKLDLISHFSLVLGGNSLPKMKPDPMPILEVISKFSLPPQSTIIIGDSSNDIDSGKSAGILTCAVSYGFKTKEELESYHPDFLIDHFSELENIFI